MADLVTQNHEHDSSPFVPKSAKGNTAVIEGSMAVAQAVKASRPAVVSAYPITPQTHIVEFLARMAAEGELGGEYVRADSEFSAASIIAGASATGVRAYTASSSQGLLLMTEVIYYIAGSRLPVVLTAANRQVSAPISLQPEHHDSMSLRDTGLIQLYVESGQEAYDAHLQAFRIAEDHNVLLPVMVCVDGYVLTHAFEPITTFDQASVDAFLPPYKPLHFLDPTHPGTFGTIADETNSLEFHYMLQQATERAKKCIDQVAQDYKRQFGHFHGGLVDCYATADAEIILVAMGSQVSTLREAVDRLRDQGVKVGLLKIRTFRPFPAEQVREAVKNAAIVVVLDRALSMGFQGILTGDVKAALYDAPKRPLVMGMLAGYGGREVTLETARSIVDQARRNADLGTVTSTMEFVGLQPNLLNSTSRTERDI
jgi:pyruvate ferredoxin oxidoreductase alpha subunit